MLRKLAENRTVAGLLWTSLLAGGMSGCSRSFWRKQAEHDTYHAVAEKLNDPHWQVPRIDLTPDERSRFYDPYDPDCEPLPPDDPAAHEFMHCVNGQKGYKSWHKLGRALSIENPQWLEPYGVLMQGVDPVEGHSQVELPEVTLQDAVELAYIHSRDYQTQIEDLYLAALSLTFERFEFGVRYLGTNGGEPGGSLFSNILPSGRDESVGAGSNFGFSQLLPSGAQWAVQIANQTLWVFGSPGTNSASTLSFTLTQPLLFGAGRKIVLEGLTQAERNVLYEARDLARFRQTLFVDIAGSYLQLLQQRQNINNLDNNIRQLQEQIEIQRSENQKPNRVSTPLAQFDRALIPESLVPYLRYDETGTLKWQGDMSAELEAQFLAISDDVEFQAAAQEIIGFKRQDTTPLSVAELVTQLNGAQNNREDALRRLADITDGFKINLGLPPNVRLEVDESLLLPFQLIDPELVAVERELKDLALERGDVLIPQRDALVDDTELPPPDFLELRGYVVRLQGLRDRLYELGLIRVQSDFEPVQELLEDTAESLVPDQAGERFFTAEDERDRVITDVEGDLRLYRINERDFALKSAVLDMLGEILQSGDTAEEVFAKLDVDGNGRIQETELPSEWQDLPRVGAQQSDRSLDLGGFLAAARTGAGGLREEFEKIAQSLQVIQAGLRVETIALNRFTLPGESESPDLETVERLGLEKRHDLMNARAAVMDARRAVEIAANALEAGLDVRVDGSAGTLADTNRPFDFRGSRSSYRVGLEFTAPVDQINERNAYNRALVNYQRARRTYMAQEDAVKLQIRTSWRQLEVSEQQVEIDRQTVRNAAKQLDSAALAAGSGRGGQSNSLSLLRALDTVLRAQNSLVGDWITYERSRLNIFRDMGIMQIDPQGLWQDRFYQAADGNSASDAVNSTPVPEDMSVLPPPIPSPDIAEPVSD